MAGIKDLLQACSDLVFPPSCIACGTKIKNRPAVLFCSSCIAQLKTIQEPLCTVCGKVFKSAIGENHLCSTCIKKPPFFSKARSIILYSKPVPQIIHKFKYKRSTVGLNSFYVLKKSLPHLDSLSAVDIIAPVPLHPKRLRQRGYNQALLLARHLFPEYKQKIIPDLLHKMHNSLPQASLNGKARRQNLKNAFYVKRSELAKDRRILLVDDVFTTGTTINECAKTLKKAGAIEVQALTLARVEE